MKDRGYVPATTATGVIANDTRCPAGDGRSVFEVAGRDFEFFHFKDLDVLLLAGIRADAVCGLLARTTAALSHYLKTSRDLSTCIDEDAFFLNMYRRRPHPTGLEQAFRFLRNYLGFAAHPGGKAPRLHDFRHTYATNALLQACRDGVDVDVRIAVLATYLGHVSPASTYWYLTAIPELLALASDRVRAAQTTGALLS